jgi:hypothetical protein
MPCRPVLLPDDCVRRPRGAAGKDMKELTLDAHGNKVSRRSSSLPPIKTDWVKDMQPPKKMGMGMGGSTMMMMGEDMEGTMSTVRKPQLVGKEGMLSDLAAGRIVDVDRRMGGSAGSFVRFPRMDKTGRIIDTMDGPDLSQKNLEDRRFQDRCAFRISLNHPSSFFLRMDAHLF